MSKRKSLAIFSVIAIFLLITGCSGLKSIPETKEQEQAQQSTSTKDNTLESDEELTKKLGAEKGIDRVMVQVVEGEQRAVNVDIVINNEQGLSPEQVIEKYSRDIKEKYPDRTIDIIVAKEGKLLKQATIK